MTFPSTPVFFPLERKEWNLFVEAFRMHNAFTGEKRRNTKRNEKILRFIGSQYILDVKTLF